MKMTKTILNVILVVVGFNLISIGLVSVAYSASIFPLVLVALGALPMSVVIFRLVKTNIDLSGKGGTNKAFAVGPKMPY